MKLANVAAAGAVVAASAAFAGGKVPPGWMEVANSNAQFSGVQGQAGWTYRFDRGFGTVSEPMPYFGSAGTHLGNSAWNALTTADTYCIQYASRMHANAPGACSAAWAGTLRPIRRWESSAALPSRVRLVGSIAPNTAALQVELLLDGAVVFAQTATNGSNTEIVFETSRVLQRLEVRIDPLGNDCNADVIDGMLLTVLTPDCNANGVADAFEISSGAASDQNQDGVPDGCQCYADVIPNGVVDGSDLAAVLGTWGTDGGIYPRADTNADGIVDGNDLAVVLGGWGACP